MKPVFFGVLRHETPGTVFSERHSEIVKMVFLLYTGEPDGG